MAFPTIKPKNKKVVAGAQKPMPFGGSAAKCKSCGAALKAGKCPKCSGGKY